MRPILRPGTHVLSRGAGELQVGLDPRHALVLPDSAPVRESLRLLGSSADLAEHADPAVVDLLDRARPARRRTGPPAPARLARAAPTRDRGARPDDRLGGRRRARRPRAVAHQTVSFGHAAGAGLRSDLLALLREAGLRELPRPVGSRLRRAGRCR